jgi:hypothetical protein
MYFLGNKAEKLEQLVETSFVYHDIAFDHALAYLEPSEEIALADKIPSIWMGIGSQCAARSHSLESQNHRISRATLSEGGLD